MKCTTLLLILINLITIFWFQVGKVYGIVGGYDVLDGLYRYHVSVQNRLGHICGGGVITEKHVLTAAQCIIGENGNFKNEKFWVLTGIIKLNDNNPSRSLTEVESAYVPLEYKPKGSENRQNPNKLLIRGDIAVLKLKYILHAYGHPLFTKLKLPKRIKGQYSKYLYHKGFVTGFGVDAVVNRGPGTYHNSYKKLKFIEATIGSKVKCISMWNDREIQDSHFCATADQFTSNHFRNAGVCDGDEGAPLVLSDDTIVGILSVPRPNCNEADSGAIYTRITEYVNFIKDAINNKYLSTIRMASYADMNVLEVITDRLNDLITV